MHLVLTLSRRQEVEGHLEVACRLVAVIKEQKHEFERAVHDLLILGIAIGCKRVSEHAHELRLYGGWARKDVVV